MTGDGGRSSSRPDRFSAACQVFAFPGGRVRGVPFGVFNRRMMDLPLYWVALIGFLVINVMLVSASLLVYYERKIAGWIQNRPGPNRVGPYGILQPFADVAKLIFKEDIQPKQANTFVHSLAPVLMVVIAMTTASLIPFARGFVISDMNVSVLVVLALTSISVYGVTLAGW